MFDLKEINSFSELVLITSFLDQYEYSKNYEFFEVSLESIGYTYLKEYFIHYDERFRLSLEEDEIIFNSIENKKIQFKSKGIEIDDYESLLLNFKDDVKEQFIEIIHIYIIPLIKKDISAVSSKIDFGIIYSEQDEKLIFTKDVILNFKNHYYYLRKEIENKIKIIDFSNIRINKKIFMTLDDVLSALYHSEDDSIGSMAKLHLFGIAYSDELKKMKYKDREEMVVRVTGKKSLYQEINKGMALSEHVTINKIDKIPILKNSKYDINTDKT